MIFSKDEDKKYIYNCPLTLLKCSFHLRSAVNNALAKFVVVLTPTMKLSQFSMDSAEIPLSLHSPMKQPTSFVVWNIRGTNNDNFKRNFKELKNHNPCIVTLLETKMEDHLCFMTEFGFVDYWEVPAQDRSGDIVMLWLTSYITVTRKKHSPEEPHAMIQILPNQTTYCFTVVYASTTYNDRMKLWDSRKDIADSIDNPWLVVGDFNEIITQ